MIVADSMLTDGRSTPTGTVLVADVCIIGGGPAGLVIAQELIGTGTKILLLDRGDVNEPPDADLTFDFSCETPISLAPAGPPQSVRRYGGRLEQPSPGRGDARCALPAVGPHRLRSPALGAAQRVADHV